MEPTLDSLIQTAFEIKNGLRKEYGPYWDYYVLADNQKYENWANLTQRFLMAKFTNDPCIEKFDKACEKFIHDGCDPSDMDKMIAILESCKIIPSLPRSNSPKTSSGKSINVNVNQSQSQTQSQSQAVEILLEVIRDEVPGKYLKELKAIASEEKDPQKAKSKIFDKLKSWGADTLSNIVANLLTNPAIFSGLTGL